MLDEFIKALGPWPILQTMLGLAVLGAGAYAIFKGINKKDQDEKRDPRVEWAAYEQLKNIEANSFKMVEQSQRMIEAIQRLADVIWNENRLRP